MGDRAEEWVKSIHSEMDGLNDQGVFSHNYTLDDIRNKHGITSNLKPIPCSVALTHKFKQDESGSSVLARLKTRICIAGHSPG